MLKVNAVQLRAIADYASSLRTATGDSLYITADPQEESTGFLVMGTTSASTGSPVPDNVVAEVDTHDVTPGRPAVTAALIAAEKGQLDLLGKYDAVFWSEAAVEKFVIPYYASKSLWMAGHVLKVLCEKWYGRVPGTLSTSADAGSEIPFALAHLPNSDYVTLASADEPLTVGAIGSDLVLLGVDPGTGNITETPLSFYL